MTEDLLYAGCRAGFRRLRQWLPDWEAEDLTSNPCSVAALLCDLGQITFPPWASAPFPNTTQTSKFQWTDVQNKSRGKQIYKVVPGAMSIDLGCPLEDSAPQFFHMCSTISGKMVSLYTMNGVLGTLLAPGPAP